MFIALMALVIMMMGVLAVMRSIDSATGIAGNIGFRQQGVAATDIAVEAATTWLVGAGNLNNSIPADGYYATQDFGIINDDILKFDWSANGRKLGDQNGYQLWYVIHRLCSAAGAPEPGICTDSGNTLTQDSDTGETVPLTSGGLTPLYRITARALGPRNSESVVQVITY